MGLKEIVTLTVYQDTFDWHQQMTQDWKINAQGGGKGTGGEVAARGAREPLERPARQQKKKMLEVQ